MTQTMTITQTVDIPASRRVTLDVPPEIPEGKMRIIVQFPIVNPNRKSISQYFDIISPNTFGDGVAYQRKLRDDR